MNFLFILAIALPFPLFWMSGGFSNQENKENRTLKEFPTFHADKWDTYFVELDTFINDYAPFKNLAVTAYNSFQIDWFGETDINAQVIVGKEDWLFSKHDDAYENYKNFHLPDEKDLQYIAEQINKMQQLCQEKNISFHFSVMPNKEQIYGEYMPPQIKVSDLKTSGIEMIMNHVNDSINFQFIYPKDELLKEKENHDVYYKYDSHWNRIGGFIGAQQIIDAISGSRSYVKDVQWTVRNDRVGDLAILLNMDQRYNNDCEYNGNYLSDVTYETVERSSDSRFIHTKCAEAKNDRVLLLICDSFSNNMRQYLAKNFKECYFIRRELAMEKDFNIISMNPDIIVVESVQRLAERVLSTGLPKFIADLSNS